MTSSRICLAAIVAISLIACSDGKGAQQDRFAEAAGNEQPKYNGDAPGWNPNAPRDAYDQPPNSYADPFAGADLGDDDDLPGGPGGGDERPGPGGGGERPGPGGGGERPGPGGGNGPGGGGGNVRSACSAYCKALEEGGCGVGPTAECAAECESLLRDTIPASCINQVAALYECMVKSGIAICTDEFGDEDVPGGDACLEENIEVIFCASE